MQAQLEPWQDYEASDAVYLVTTNRGHSNMDHNYLEGLAKTWVPGNEIAEAVTNNGTNSATVSRIPAKLSTL